MNTYYIDEASGITARTSNKEIIANFFVKLKAIKVYTKNNSVVQKIYVLQFYNPDYVGEAEVDIKDLDKFDYSSIGDTLLLSPTVSTAGKEMAYYIKSQSVGVVPQKVYLFDKLGWQTIEGQHCYCAGNTIIGNLPSENYKISERLTDKYHLEVDNTLSEQNAVSYIIKLLNIESCISSLVFASGLLGVMRQIIIDADIRIPCIPYVFGDSQTRKTTLVNLATRLYNRSELNSDTSVSSMRVSSTEFKSEEQVDELKDATFIFDDLYKEPSTKQRKIYENRVRNLIRNFADNSSRTTVRSSFKNNCQIIVTAEYLLKSKTDIGRMMLLYVDKPINSDRLAECQQQPLALSTFYYYFMKWLSSNYDNIVSRLRTKYLAFRSLSHNHDKNYERLYEQFFLLDFVFSILVEYFLNVGITADKDCLLSQFADFIRKALSQQQVLLENLESEEVKEINLSSELLSMIEDKTIIFGKKGSECFKKDNKIYITNEHFGKALYKKYNKKYTSKAIAAYFRNRYISEIYADNRPKKYNNKCYLVLKYFELIRDAKDDSYTYNNLFFD